MVNELRLPEDQMIFSVDELKTAGSSHYKINQLVEGGTLLKLNSKWRRKDRNLNRLLRYAELLKCGEVMKTYLEVLV